MGKMKTEVMTIEKPTKVITNPVDKFAKMAKSGTPRYQSIAEYDAEIERLQKIQDELLGIELDAKTEVAALIKDVARDKKIDQTLDGNNPYKRLSLEPFSWVGPDMRPIFALFSIENPVMKITASHSAVSCATIPKEILDVYKTVVKPTKSYYSTTTHTAKFIGVIPASVRENIKKAMPIFETKKKVIRARKSVEVSESNIYIVAEAHWDSKTVTRNPDPLVVGWDGKTLRLIDQFDLTSLERYMKEEFPG